MIRLLSLVLFLLPIALLRAQTVALTLDDAPALGSTPLMDGGKRNEALLEAFRRQGVQVAIFVNGIDGGDSDEGRRTLSAWGRSGHWVGNHTYSHPNLQRANLHTYIQDFKRCDDLIRPLPGYAAWFRFPYLKEGETRSKRDGMRTALQSAGYRNAHVTVPTFDWLIDQHLREALRRDPRTPLEPYRAYYLRHVLDAVRRHEALGRQVAGRGIAHVVLLHHNLLNALFAEDLVLMLRANGCRIVSPAVAYEDPIYRESPESLNAGEDLLTTLALEKGLEPERMSRRFLLEKSMFEELGL